MKEKVLFVAFSHTLTPEQIADAKATLNAESIVALREERPDLQSEFSQIPPDATLGVIKGLAEDVVDCALTCGADYFYCTGEPSVTIHANMLAQKHGLTCIMSTTRRDAKETTAPDGSVTRVHVFKHVQWRNVF